MATTGSPLPTAPLGQPADPAPPAKSQNELLGIVTRAVAEVVNLKIITVVTPVTLGGSLDKPIDGITGATLSVQALTRLAGVALFLDENVGCVSGA